MICRSIASIRLLLILTLSFTLIAVLCLVKFFEMGFGDVKQKRLRSLLTKGFCRVILRAAGLNLRYDTRYSHVSNRPALIIANHITYLDIVIIGAQFGCIFLAKRSVFTWPVFGQVAALLGCIPVDRESVPSKVRALMDLKRHFATGQSICVFPEGTTHKDLYPNWESWHCGHLWAARQCAIPVVCVGIAYEDQEQIGWIDDMEFVPNLWDILTRSGTYVQTCSAVLKEAQTISDIRLLGRFSYHLTHRLCEQAHLLLGIPSPAPTLPDHEPAVLISEERSWHSG